MQHGLYLAACEAFCLALQIDKAEGNCNQIKKPLQ